MTRNGARAVIALLFAPASAIATTQPCQCVTSKTSASRPTGSGSATSGSCNASCASCAPTLAWLQMLGDEKHSLKEIRALHAKIESGRRR
jgi:hypothetical protein